MLTIKMPSSLHWPGDGVIGRDDRAFCRRLNVVADRAHRQRDSRAHTCRKSHQGTGGAAIRYPGKPASDMATPPGGVRCPVYLRQLDTVLDVPREGSMSAGRRPSGFLKDLHSYLAHQQQSSKEARNARGEII